MPERRDRAAEPTPPAAIGPLDLGDRREVEQAARLHRKYFPRTTEARCGLRFLARVYWPTLIRDGSIGCLVARRDGQVVSYALYSLTPRSYLKRSARLHPVALGAGFALASLTRLDATRAVLRHAWAAVRPSRKTGQRPSVEADCGELLYIATLPEHRPWKPPGADARVSVEIFAAAMTELRRGGARRALLMSRKTNGSSFRLNRSMGCRIDPSVNHPIYHFWWLDLNG